MALNVKMATIFLNRECPRKCPYCNLVEDSPSLTIAQWKQAFEIMRNNGTEFFLILGCEPLAMKEDIVSLVEFLTRGKYNYGFYSSAPKQYTYLLDQLIEKGLTNYSCGVDYIEEVYKAHKWSETTETLLKKSTHLIEKAKDSFDALYQLQHKIREVHATITISRMNIQMVPYMIEYLVTKIPQIHIGLNFVHYSQEECMDFATKQNNRFFFTEADRDVLIAFRSQMRSLSNKYLNHVQVPLEYLDNIDQIINLSWKCSDAILSIDSNGLIRLCGYKKLTKPYFIFDFEQIRSELEKVINDEQRKCKGCYWSCPFVFLNQGMKSMDFTSKYWSEKLNENISH